MFSENQKFLLTVTSFGDIHFGVPGKKNIKLWQITPSGFPLSELGNCSLGKITPSWLFLASDHVASDGWTWEKEKFLFRDSLDKIELPHPIFNEDTFQLSGELDNLVLFKNKWENGFKDILKKYERAQILYSEVSPCGRYFLTSSVDNSAKLYDLLELSASPTILGHGKFVRLATFSPIFSDTDPFILTLDFGLKLRLWNANGTEIPIFKGYLNDAQNVNWSNNGKCIYVRLRHGIHVFPIDRNIISYLIDQKKIFGHLSAIDEISGKLGNN